MSGVGYNVFDSFVLYGVMNIASVAETASSSVPRSLADSVESKNDEAVITRDMILGEIVADFPDTALVMMEYGLHCVGCFANAFDTVESGARIHGLSEEEINQMVSDMNEVIS